MIVSRVWRHAVARLAGLHGLLPRMLALPVTLAMIMLLLPAAAQAQIGSDRYSSIVMDAATGTIIISVSPDEPRYPASLTKMMTLYMAFEALRDRRLTREQMVPVSEHAASMSPSKLGLMPGTRLTVEQAILGLVTKSANDAAAALGELLGGDEDRFAQMMTLRARALGMAHTTFRNASGLPDPQQMTTARDLAMLARHLVQDFPGDYRYFSVPSFTFHGRVIPNHDHLLQSYPGADGIKTGYIEASGFNLVTSAVRSDVRLIGVVIGAAKPGERDQHMAALMDRGFESMGIAPVPRGGARAQAQAQAQAGAPAPVQPLPGRRPQVFWAAQLGPFPSQTAARSAADIARRAADAGDIRIEPVAAHGRTSYRASLAPLTQPDARAACAAAARKHLACAAVRSDSGQLASR